MSASSARFGSLRRLVVKIGSSLIVSDSGEVRFDRLESFCDDLAALRAEGREIVVVCSGAVALGRRVLRLPLQGELRSEESQAAAAAGQMTLAHAWRESLERRGIASAQLLMTLYDTERRRRYLNARETLLSLLRRGALPIINENDGVADGIAPAAKAAALNAVAKAAAKAAASKAADEAAVADIDETAADAAYAAADAAYVAYAAADAAAYVSADAAAYATAGVVADASNIYAKTPEVAHASDDAAYAAAAAVYAAADAIAEAAADAAAEAAEAVKSAEAAAAVKAVAVAKVAAAKAAATKAAAVKARKKAAAAFVIRYGNNDDLAARVAGMLAAEGLIMLSDVDGLYRKSEEATNIVAAPIPEVRTINYDVESLAAASSSEGVGSGGMSAKLAAARIALAAGVHAVIASGLHERPLLRLAENAPCTWFIASKKPSAARKIWIAGTLNPMGSLIVDDGARAALMSGKSLLAAGVLEVEGEFSRGDAVAIAGTDKRPFARGLIGLDSADAERIAGRRSADVAKILGKQRRGELVHRDNLALLDAESGDES